MQDVQVILIKKIEKTSLDQACHVLKQRIYSHAPHIMYQTISNREAGACMITSRNVQLKLAAAS